MAGGGEGGEFCAPLYSCPLVAGVAGDTYATRQPLCCACAVTGRTTGDVFVASCDLIGGCRAPSPPLHPAPTTALSVYLYLSRPAGALDGGDTGGGEGWEGADGTGKIG
jgi:hypothetical protein